MGSRSILLLCIVLLLGTTLAVIPGTVSEVGAQTTNFENAEITLLDSDTHLYRYTALPVSKVTTPEGYLENYYIADNSNSITFTSSAHEFEFHKDTCSFTIRDGDGNTEIGNMAQKFYINSDSRWQDITPESCTAQLADSNNTHARITASSDSRGIEFNIIFDIYYAGFVEWTYEITNNQRDIPNPRLGVVEICTDCASTDNPFLNSDGTPSDPLAFRQAGLEDKDRKNTGEPGKREYDHEAVQDKLLSIGTGMYDAKNEQHGTLSAIRLDNNNMEVEFFGTEALPSGQTMVIDPSFTIGATALGLNMDSNPPSVTTPTPPDLWAENRTSLRGIETYVGYIDISLDNIPRYVTIHSVSLSFTVRQYSDLIDSPTLSIYPKTFDPPRTGQSLSPDQTAALTQALNGETYYSEAISWPAYSNQTILFNKNAANDLQSSIDRGDDPPEFGILAGLSPLGIGNRFIANNLEFHIDYGPGPAPRNIQLANVAPLTTSSAVYHYAWDYEGPAPERFRIEYTDGTTLKTRTTQDGSARSLSFESGYEQTDIRVRAEFPDGTNSAYVQFTHDSHEPPAFTSTSIGKSDPAGFLYSWTHSYEKYTVPDLTFELQYMPYGGGPITSIPGLDTLSHEISVIPEKEYHVRVMFKVGDTALVTSSWSYVKSGDWPTITSLAADNIKSRSVDISFDFDDYTWLDDFTVLTYGSGPDPLSNNTVPSTDRQVTIMPDDPFPFGTITVRVIPYASDGSDGPPAEIQFDLLPISSILEPQTVNKGDAIEYTIPIDNPANQVITWSILLGHRGDADINSDGLFTWTTTRDDGPGTYQFGIRAEAETNTIYYVLDVTVNEVNRRPVIRPAPPIDVLPGALSSFVVSATDPDPGTTLSYALVDPPAGATINPTTGLFSWTPSDDQTGIHIITVRVSDDHPDYPETAEEQITFIVGVNMPPSLVPPVRSYDLTEGEVFFTTPHRSVTDDAFAGYDILTYSLSESAPDTMTVDRGTGRIDWTPSTGDAGRYSFLLIVSDGQLTDTMRIRITVAGAPTP